MSAQKKPCPHCGLLHRESTCPRIKGIEYHPDGTIKRVEFVTAADQQVGDGSLFANIFGPKR